MAQLDKIKVRNLDEEVLEYFRRNDGKITFDGLDPSVVTEIKNGKGTNKYNDAELRSRIIILEDDKLSKKDAQDTYRKSEDSYTKKEIDDMLGNYGGEVEGKLTVEKADERYLQKQDNVITENYLSEDLRNKVNARYENKRPEGSGGSGSEGGSTGGVNQSDFNILRGQVDNNTTNLATLKDYVQENTISKENKITREFIDPAIVSTIDDARPKSVLIGMSDLNEEVTKKLSNTLQGSFDTLEANIKGNTQSIEDITENMALLNGNVMMGAQGSNSTNPILKQCLIYSEDIVIVSKTEWLNDAMKELEEDNKDDKDATMPYIIVDAGEEKAHLYSYKNGQWAIDTTIGAAELMVGRFASGYRTKNLYFGISTDEFEIVVDAENTATKTEINSLKTQIEALKKEIAALKNPTTPGTP